MPLPAIFDWCFWNKSATNWSSKPGGGAEMVERISLGFTPPDRSELRRRVAESIARGVTEEELAEQRVSFVYGNAPVGSGITKDSARHAASHARLVVNE
jgi:hypothetical protein